MDMLVYVIVVTYKGFHWYKRCFDSLRESELPVKTIVVDNASNDGTVEYIKENYPEIHLIESKENLGFGRANNIGLRYALQNGCDYVFLLNQDAWIEPNTVKELYTCACDNSQWAILSPIQLIPNTNNILPAFWNVMLYDNNRELNYNLLNSFYDGKNTVSEIFLGAAAAWLIPRDTIDLIGGFDPIFYHYGEDDDYVARIRYHGLRVGLVFGSRIYHDSTPANYSCKLSNEQRPSYKSWMLNRAMDINNSDDEIVIMLRKLYVSVLKKIFKLQYKFVVGEFKKIVFLYSKKRDVLKHRTINKQLGRNWL